MTDGRRRSCNGDGHLFIYVTTHVVKPAELSYLYLWRRIQKLVEGGHELSPYLQWQRDMREQDLQEELAKIGRRHLEGRISHEEAAAARMHVVERNQKTAQLTKEEVCYQLARANLTEWIKNTTPMQWGPPPPPLLLWNVCVYAQMCFICLIDSWTNEEIRRATAAGGKRNEGVGATSCRRTQELKVSERETPQVQARYR